MVTSQPRLPESAASAAACRRGRIAVAAATEEELAPFHPGMRDPQHPMRCAGCGQDIVDRFYLLAADQRWHLACLRCHHCQDALDSHRTCYAKDGRIYCRQDYVRLFPPGRCSGCGSGVHREDLVMRVRELIFHVDCFLCAHCGHPLTKGQQFGLREGRLLCSLHLNRDEEEVEEDLSFAICKGKRRRRKAASSGEELVEEEGSDLLHQRSKRMRTSFKHGQLRAMKEYFAANHNPDAKDLRQLSARTGLSKRVLQVWFQNARAKWRRNLLRQGTQGPEVAQDSTLLTEVTSEGEECPILQEHNALSPSPPQVSRLLHAACCS